MTCSKCGAPLQSGAMICGKCGLQFVSPVPSTPTIDAQRKGGYLIGWSILAVVIGICAFGSTFSPNGSAGQDSQATIPVTSPHKHFSSGPIPSQTFSQKQLDQSAHAGDSEALTDAKMENDEKEIYGKSTWKQDKAAYFAQDEDVEKQWQRHLEKRKDANMVQISVGEMGYLRHDNSDAAIVASGSEDSFNEYMKFNRAKDIDGMNQLILSHRCAIVPENTTALVINSNPNSDCTDIRIKSGELDGYEVYVPCEWCLCGPSYD